MLDRTVTSHTVMLLALLLVLWLISGAQSSDPAPLTVMYQVWEEQPVGTRVGRLVDDLRQRGETGVLEDFQVVEHGQALPFSIEVRDGTVATLGQLDREELCRGSDLCELAFSVLYRKGGVIHFLRVRVEVMDLNDHSPTFPSSQQEVEISEMATLRMRIPLDRAVDPDAGPNGLQTYSLSVNQHFALDVRSAVDGPKQAELVVIKELDREVHSSFELTLVAWDKGNPPRSGSTLVQVNVLDSNDNSPMFEDSTPTVELAEDTARGTSVINLKATDPDQGANGEVEYSLSKHAPPEVQKLFSIHPQSGVVTLKGQLDYEAKHFYEVDIQARDLGPNAIPSHCKLHIKIRDVNDNAPRIHVTWTPPDSPVATVLEGAPEDTFLALVMVSDADSGDNGNVHAHIQHGSGHFRLKKIHGDNYMIVTNGTLDREKVMEYNLTLLAQDYGDPPLSCVRHLVVHVLDENDNAPVFSKSHYRASFKENNTVGLQVLKVEANDVDIELSGRVSFSIRESNELGPPTASFAIHPTSGVVSAQQSLDYEESPTYSFIVEAIDHGHPPLTSTATVLIEIQDVNDNYPVIKEPMPKEGIAFVSVPVNEEKGEIVTQLGDGAEEGSTDPHTGRSVQNGFMGFLATTIKANDPDSGLNGRLSYMITDGNPTGLFRLNDTTGQLYVNTTNATELIGKTFKVDIAVSDKGSPRLLTKFTLEVAFINLRDHLKNSAPGNHGQLSFTMMVAICLGASCILLLLTVALVTTFCRPTKRDNHSYNCRTAESTYTSHPRRPQKNIRKTDIQLVPVLRGRREDPPEDDEAQPLSPMLLVVEEQNTETQYSVANSMNPTVPSQAYPEGGSTLPVSHSRTLRKPGSIELDGTLPWTPAIPYRTLRKARNPSSSSSLYQTSTLRRHGNSEIQVSPDVEVPETSSQVATLRRPKNTDTRSGLDAEDHRRMLRNLVRLSMAAFGENSIELSAASPEVQQVSQLLSLLHQGQLQPRPNFRGNKFSQRAGRSYAQDTDWQSTKDSGHGESEAGDMDWDMGRDSPVDPLLEEGLNNLLNNPDDVFADIGDPAWMSRLSLPLTADYHENVFVPNGPPSPKTHCSPDTLDSASFSTFGKKPEDGSLGGALISEVNTLFNMLLTQKGDSQPRPSPDVLYRLSATYRRSLGLEGDTAAAGGANIQRNSVNPEKRSPLAQCP
ncbi:protocadherin-12 isoform X1 [Oncorhynchus mykiss]|uniref:Protocadherin 12 n=1 Tax=Oncorhynchus mykiss TaxID=8022 RepID=A0A8C7UTS5_ONCMY|nr:protocadherin-12 isoform X1 [Oncorhynchus mykiss]